MVTILIVEDDENIRKLMAMYLSREGYRVIEAADGMEALAIFDRELIDLMVADIMMPRKDGLSLTRELRDRRYSLPILIVTAKERIEDKRDGFLAGTDDYLVKPIDFDELCLRVGALLRRAEIQAAHRLTFGDVVLDSDDLTVTLSSGGQTDLTPKEFQLLFKLLSYPGRIFTRFNLMDDVWGYDSDSDERTVDVHIKRLRDKLGDVSAFSIVTVKGLGYKAVKNK
jgi:DNA-binding response OmpR family regulator